MPGKLEIKANPRARSGRLRVVEKQELHEEEEQKEVT
jgi:16S rRNA C1402 N4-methylase RsmH